MKRFSILLLGLLLGSALLGVIWFSLRPDSEPEVQKIYKVPSSYQKSTEAQETKRSDTFSAAPIVPVGPTTNKTGSSDKDAQDDIHSLLKAEGFSAEEIAAFWEWLATQQEEEKLNGEETASTNINLEADIKKPTFIELSNLVRGFYDLQSIFEMYDIEFELGRAICPFCSSRTLSTIVNGATGRRDFWHCRNCLGGRSDDMFGFVARMEGITDYEAAKFLAERASLLE